MKLYEEIMKANYGRKDKKTERKKEEGRKKKEEGRSMKTKKEG